MNFRAHLLSGLLLLAVLPAHAERTVVSLDGKWSFRLDPEDVGRAGQWFSAQMPFTNSIIVPGAWQAQGYGSPSDKLRHNYVGKAWYKREVQLPKLKAGQRLFLCIGGAHRSAEVWVDGRLLGGHLGYLSPFEFELSGLAAANGSPTVTIALCVDCRQHWELDCLTGCTDIIDEMFTEWGGIWGHILLEVRPAAWLEDVFVQPRVSPPGCLVTARVAGDTNLAGHARLEVRSPAGKRLAAVEQPLSPGGAVRFETDLPDAPLWSPDSPARCTASLQLIVDTPAQTPADRVEVPFGLREIRIEGSSLLLNGKKLFLRGYGDDAIYPKTMAPPSEVEFYRQRLKVAKSYGFNFVRHHSHFLPPEYYTAADEVGMLISPEFPIAYEQYYQKAKGPALDLYRSEWSAIIKRLRNHPSIFDWSMANEMWGSFPLAPELYRAAKALDPTRPVIDSDGLPADTFVQRPGNRDTLDFFPVQFDEGALPLDNPAKHRFGIRPLKPVLSHETGNYVTVPRPDLAALFKDNFRPFWLKPFRAKLEKLGLLAEAMQWSLNSERLYWQSHKVNVESMRKNPQMSGYMWWLLQDYWTGANGLLDTYSRPKSISPDMVRRFNAPIVLLEDGLALTYAAGQPLKLKLLVSNFSPETIRGGKLEWTVRLGNRVLARGKQENTAIGQGELAEAAIIQAELPEVAQPEKLVVQADIQACPGSQFGVPPSGGSRAVPPPKGGTPNRAPRTSTGLSSRVPKSDDVRSGNDWYAWVFPVSRSADIPVRPAQTSAPADKNVRAPIFAGADVAQWVKGSGAQPMPADEVLPTRAVFVVSQPTHKVLKALESGASVVCLSSDGLFPQVPNRFKPAWWLGSPNDCNAGTVVYPHFITRPIAPDGWCDLGWYRLLEGAHAYVLDDVPFAATAGASPVLVRGLDVHTVCRNKALLFEARVGLGSIIVSGLRLEPRADAPERAWLLARLIEYAATFPQPKAILPVAFLRERIQQVRVPDGPFLQGFARVLTQNCEQTQYQSYREAEAPIFVCRQLEPGRSLEWETAPVPADWKGKVTFVFAGGLGWKSEPEAGGFALLVNGRQVVGFDITSQRQTWSDRSGQIELTFVPRNFLPQDALGLFYLTLPLDQLEPGKPCHLAVRSKGKDSRRWFGLNPYANMGTGK